MGQGSTLAFKSANSATVQAVGKSAPSGRVTTLVMQAAHALWPRKTAAEVALRADVSVRSAERWIGGHRELSADAIVSLLRSDEGLHFLAAVMESARPAWWTALLRMGLLGSIERRRQADLRLLQRIADADRPQPAAISHALLLQDEEFYGPLAAAARVFEGGAADRAVGEGRKPRR